MNQSRRARLLLGLLLSLLVIAIFAARALRHAPRPSVDEAIQPWMSVGYVARSYHVPAPALLQALGLPNLPDHRPLSAVAASQQRPVSELIAILDRAIADYRAVTPTPGAQPADPPRPHSLWQRLLELEPGRAL